MILDRCSSSGSFGRKKREGVLAVRRDICSIAMQMSRVRHSSRVRALEGLLKISPYPRRKKKKKKLGYTIFKRKIDKYT